jgi:hypothetical protein
MSASNPQDHHEEPHEQELPRVILWSVEEICVAGPSSWWPA